MLDDEHDSLVHHVTRSPSHGRPLMDDRTSLLCLLHHQLPLVHRGRPCEGATVWKINVYIYIYYLLFYTYVIMNVFSSLSSFLFFFCHVSYFNSLLVTSISVLEVGATCRSQIGLCRFICPGQQPIYSGIPPLPLTFAKSSPLTFLV